MRMRMILIRDPEPDQPTYTCAMHLLLFSSSQETTARWEPGHWAGAGRRGVNHPLKSKDEER